MKDFIKEFTLLDLLGMIFPGSVLMVLVCAECGAWRMIEQFVGSGMIGAVKPVVILFGGYALGMLLHDLGDMAERMLWRNPVFNPKVNVLLDQNKASLLEKEEKNREAQQDGKAEKDGEAEAAKEPERADAPSVGQDAPRERKRWYQIFWAWFTAWLLRFPDKFKTVVGTPFSFALMSVLCLCCLFYVEWSLKEKLCQLGLWVSVGGIVLLSIIFAVMGLVIWEDKIKKNQKLLAYHAAISKSDTVFATKQTEHRFKVDASKVNLLDGFRAMARNLLVAIFLAYVLAHFSKGIFYELFLIPFTSQFPAICFFVVLLLLVLRYWRYSYLQYKYIYEDIAYIEKEEKKEEKNAPGPEKPKKK